MDHRGEARLFLRGNRGFDRGNNESTNEANGMNPMTIKNAKANVLHYYYYRLLIQPC